MKKRIISILLVVALLSTLLFSAKNNTPEENNTDRKLAKSGQLYNAADSNINVPDSLEPCDIRPYTIMIYMIGSNLESRLGNGTKDLEEIEASGFDSQKANIIIFTGGSKRWIGDVPSEYNCIIDMSKEADCRIIAHTDGNADMGAEQTLAEFINFCSFYYPAEHNALIFWDHGGGPLLGYGADELFNSDSLLLPEMQNAMRSTEYSNGKKLDFVGFDACLMSCIECMNVWEEFADFYVASEELEPGDGWDYSFLRSLNTTANTPAILNSIVDSFANYYNNLASESYNPDVTLSAVDLAKLGKVNLALDNLSGIMLENDKAGNYADIAKSRSNTKCVGQSDGIKDEDELSSFDLVDIADMAKKLAWIDIIASDNLSNRLSEAIVKKYSNVDSLSGISMYYPYANKSQYRQMEKDYANITPSDNYRFFLDNSAQKWLKNKQNNWNLGQITEDETGKFIQLTDEQQENIVSSYYSVLKWNDEFGYLPVAERFSLAPDKKGRIYLPENIEVFLLDNNAEGTICPVKEIEADENRRLYSTIGLRVDNSPLLISGIKGIEAQLIGVVIAENLQDGSLTIQSVNAEDEDIALAGKNTINMSDWAGIHISYKGLLPEKDANGVTLPSYEWGKSGTFGWDEGNANEKLIFSKCPIEKLSGNFIVQIQIEDIYGDFYATDCLDWSSGIGYTNEIYKTPKGELSILIGDGHAICTQYNGEDITIDLPETINGFPLTKIASRAFYKNKTLMSINVPNNVTSIGSGAFQECSNLQKVLLPSTLSFIDIGPFAGCSNLEEIELDPANKLFCMQNDCLYSADGQVLIAYPAKHSGSFVIPESTKEVAYAAFCDSQVEEISFPDSLRIINDYAFFNSKLSKAPKLPDAMEKIGVRAFGCEIINREEIPETQVTITIGKNVNRIGTGAFDLFTSKVFEVSSDNPYYTSIEGNLMNKAGDYLIQFATRNDNVVIIPDGTLNFSAESMDFFSLYSYLTKDYNVSDNRIKLQIPSSLKYFPKGTYLSINHITIHCEKDSAAEDFALESGIPVSYELDGDLFPEKNVITTDQGEFTYLLYKNHATLTHVDLTIEDNSEDDYLSEDHTVITIPSDINGVPLKTIGDGFSAVISWDSDISFYKYILEIPKGVEIISDKALSESGFNSVLLPNTIKEIGIDALSTSSYDSVMIIPDSVETLKQGFLHGKVSEEFSVGSSLKEVDPGAFGYCTGLKEFVSGNSSDTYSVKDGFLYSKDGTCLIAVPRDIESPEISVPEGTLKIADEAFWNNSNIESVALPASLTTIGNKAFHSCSLLESITIPDSVTLMGNSVFYDCTSLKSARLSKGCSSIPADTFSYCKQLEDVIIPEGVELIETNAFIGCNALADLEMPDSLKTIDSGAFYATKSESEKESVLHIGKNVSSIDLLSFNKNGFSEFIVDPENQYFDVMNNMLTDIGHNRILACPANISGTLHIPNGIVNIGYSFADSSLITDLYVPESVRWIYDIPHHYDTDKGQNVYDTTLHVKQGSYAERYAVANSIPYELY